MHPYRRVAILGWIMEAYGVGLGGDTGSSAFAFESGDGAEYGGGLSTLVSVLRADRPGGWYVVNSTAFVMLSSASTYPLSLLNLSSNLRASRSAHFAFVKIDFFFWCCLTRCGSVNLFLSVPWVPRAW